MINVFHKFPLGRISSFLKEISVSSTEIKIQDSKFLPGSGFPVLQENVFQIVKYKNILVLKWNRIHKKVHV